MHLMEIKVPYSWLRQTSGVSIVAWFEQLREKHETEWLWYAGNQEAFALIYVKINNFTDFERIRDGLLTYLDQQLAYQCQHSPSFFLVPVPHVRVVTDTPNPFVVTIFFYKQSLQVATFLVENRDYNLDVREFGQQ